jgi:hypothetical protein
MNVHAVRRRIAECPKRVWVLTGLALVSAVLLVLTGLWPAWIEKAFGVDPDHGNGSLEWIISSGAAVAFIGFGWGARLQWRRWTASLPPAGA